MRKKSIIVIAFFLIIALTSVYAQNASDFVVDFTSDFEGIIITGYNGNVRAVTIPGTIEGFPVKGIADRAFASKNITSIVIPNSVTSIGASAFDGCTSLTEITMSNNVESIGAYAFRRTSITSITLPPRLTVINQYTFANCRNLANVTIPAGVTTIANHAFFECGALTSITLPASIAIIQSNAFGNCRALTTVVIPDSVTRIDFPGNPFVGVQNFTLQTQAALRRRGWDPNAR